MKPIFFVLFLRIRENFLTIYHLMSKIKIQTIWTGDKMKILILYASKYGTTQRIVDQMCEHLSADTMNILHDKRPNLDSYDLIILGGPVYYGTLHSKLKSFIEDELDALLTKKIALFLVCMMNEDFAANQFNYSFNEKLLAHSLYDGFFGGEISKNQITLVEKFITQVAFRKKPLHDSILTTEVTRFVEEIKQRMND